jgi:integrase
MATTTLSNALVNRIVCPDGKLKADFFDSECKGLMLEVRRSGGKTYYLRYTDDRGKAHQFKLADAGDVTLAQARSLTAKARNKIAMGVDLLATRSILRSVPTFADFMSERYMPFVKGYKKSWNSDDSYLRNHLLPVLGKKHLDEINKHDVIAFHHGIKAKGLALGTANRCLILLRYAMNLAVRWEIPGVTKNPTKDVALFEDPHNKERFLTEAEAQTLYKAVRESVNPMLQYIIPMLILTGARKREVLDARWDEFDLERKQWRVSVTKAGKPRYVPLSDGVLQMLSTMPHDDSPWIFPNPKTGKPYVSFFCSWDTARIQAGLADVRIHDLRHSFASFLVNAGRSLYEVQKILGHTQIKTTQRYAHLSQDTLVAAANVVPFNISIPMVIGIPTLGLTGENLAP